LVFYTRQVSSVGQPVKSLMTTEQVEDFFRNQRGDAFLFASEERYRELAPRLPADVCVLDRRRWFLRSNQIVLLGRTGHCDHQYLASNARPATGAGP
jgi:hypothetical protein